MRSETDCSPSTYQAHTSASKRRCPTCFKAASDESSISPVPQDSQAIRTWQPDLVILDIMLPDMSGFDVLGRVRDDAELSDVRIAMLSNKDLTRSEKAQLKNAAFWRKGTLDLHTLVEAVEQQLRPVHD